MNINQIKQLVNSDQYAFLKNEPHLGNNIILLGLGGSHAYGTNIQSSDLDLRGCALNSKQELLTNITFEQFVDTKTDTTVYAFNKLIHLLCNCNPNTIEILGLKDEHYLYTSDIGRQLIANTPMFLSKKAVHAFGGYATAQLRRLDNKSARLVGQAQREQHILNSINHASYDFKTKYFPMDEESNIKLYIDQAVNEEYDKEIFMDVTLKHYPLRDYKSMWAEMQNIVREYNKVGSRNLRAIEHGKLAKHMMHLVRLYLMCFDILEKRRVITYRENDHDLLMDVRNGKYLDENMQPTQEFFDMVSEYEKRLNYAKNNTDLPDVPNYKQVNDFMMSVNERIVKEG